jgi:UDP-N-acetyl-D-galactosamine dehydrogenase
VKNARVAVLGLTFKEDCPDLRNTRVVDIVTELESYGTNVMVHDPIADPGEAEQYYGIRLTDWEDMVQLDALILATAHKQYKELPIETLLGKLNPKGTIIDVKSILAPAPIKENGYDIWRL